MILDIDHSTDVLAGAKNVDIVYIDSALTNLMPVLEELEQGHDYDNICVDNLSELEKCMLTEMGKTGKNGGAPELVHYNRTNFKLVDYIRRFRSLKGNIIFTAWEEINEIIYPTGEKFTRFYPMLTGKTKDNVCGLCNIVAHLKFNEEGRIFQLEETNIEYAKDQVYKRKQCKVKELIQ
jgi:phage nucleotide-binding protein